MKVDKQCLVSFSIRKQFFDEVQCDVVKINALPPVVRQTLAI